MNMVKIMKHVVKSYEYPQAIGKVIALKQFYIGFQMLSKD